MAETELHKRSHGHPDAELLSALEPDQIVAASSVALPRMVLGRAADLTLWSLRIFVLIITVLVVYTFILSLRDSNGGGTGATPNTTQAPGSGSEVVSEPAVRARAVHIPNSTDPEGACQWNRSLVSLMYSMAACMH